MIEILSSVIFNPYFAESSLPAFSLSAGFGSRSNPRGELNSWCYMVDLSSCQKSLLEFLLPQVSTRLAEARFAQLHFKPRHPLWLTAAPLTRPPPTRPQCTRLLPTRPTRPTSLPTRPRPAPSRSRCTTRRANQWRPPTTRPPLTSPSPHPPALLFQAFPSHSALAR